MSGYKLLSTSALLALLFLVGGCAGLRELRETDATRAGSIKNKIQQARGMDAEDCAPRELARAEAALAQARHEGMESLESSKSIEGVFTTAETAADALLAKTEPCWAAKRDTDGDGVPDARDQCPGTPRGVKVDARGCPLDTDGDGVPDARDQCPGTPRGVKVDARGCPLDTDGDGVSDVEDRCPGTPRGVKVDARGCPLDTDGDGVPDARDQCPGTPRGVKVDARGCPLDTDGDGVPDARDQCPGTPRGVKVDARGCPLDTDGDGVSDVEDRCPGTPRGVKVDARGCPLDTDGDGVSDVEDRCPGTPRGVKVDADGCPPAPKVTTLELSINFDFDSDKVQSRYMDEIRQVADFMKTHPTLDVVIEGHTDSRGAELYNLKLSAKRANQVARILNEKYGIDLDRITAQSMGEGQPIASNDTEEGRAKNRRIYAILEAEE